MIQSSHRRLMRRMCGLSLPDRVASVKILIKCSLDDVLVMVRERRISWFEHVYVYGTCGSSRSPPQK